jgi:Outer membrane protein beta-barrel domain
MKNLILFCFLVCPFFAFSQSRSSIDFMISPDYTYRIFNVPNDDKSIKPFYDSIEKPNLGFHLGVNYSRKIAKKAFLSGGIQFLTAGYYVKKDNLVWGSEINPDGSITSDLTLPHSFKSSYDYYLLNFPIALRYVINENKFSPYFEAGIVPSYNFFRRTKTTFDIGESTIQKDYDVNSFAFFTHFGFGGNLKLNDKWQVFTQSTFRYQVTSTYNSINKEHLYSIGLELGARMSL